MSRTVGHIAAVVLVLALGAPTISGAQASQTTTDTYTWSGEFVSIDAAAGTISVKARVVYPDALLELKQFKAGEKVWVVWSGVRDYSDGVRQLRRFQANEKANDIFTLPAELVSPEPQNQYITIRIKVPASSVAELKANNPGQWVTVTSRHRPATDAEAIIAVKPYVSQMNTNTNTH